ncbi:hypothetical protein FB451DRAFT_1213970 [Mycena latifolia]|nr:hypothetical protein FB451DRAFT_1213970 [Mycena latifolia]
MPISRFCKLQFTNLEHLAIRDQHAVPPYFIFDAQPLLRLPTLRRLEISCLSMDSSTFLKVFEECPPTIRHLDVSCDPYDFPHVDSPTMEPIPIMFPARAPIALDSLQLRTWAGAEKWLMHHLHRFDFSKLKVLSIDAHLAVLDHPPSLRTAEVLSFSTQEGQTRLDLSSFPNLALLRISVANVGAWPVTFDTLATIASKHGIRRIILGFLYDEATPWEELESNLANLRMPRRRSIIFEMTPEDYDRCVGHFPRLVLKKKLRRHNRSRDWFQKITRKM